MKVLSLNTWGGRAGKEGLLDFIKRHSDEVDVFCFQEIWSAPYEHMEGKEAGGKPIDHSKIMTNGLQEISALCPHHTAYFAPHFLDNYGLMMLVRNTYRVLEEGEVYVHREKGYMPLVNNSGDLGNHARNIQYVTLETQQGPVTVINFHGLWNGMGKTDTEDRLNQSRKICDFVRAHTYPYVLCGDFNLLPDTESLAILESCGMRNLITQYGVTSTRSSYYEKDIKFADYALVSSGIQVRDFVVLPDEVSDHLALCIDFDRAT